MSSTNVLLKNVLLMLAFPDVAIVFCVLLIFFGIVIIFSAIFSTVFVGLIYGNVLFYVLYFGNCIISYMV